MISNELQVKFDDHRSYPIFIGTSLLEKIDLFAPYIHGNQVCIVSNSTIAPLYLQALVDLLSTQFSVETLILPDGEKYKTIDHMTRIYDHLLSHGHNRSTTLIALGGGVVGDITGFAAATYQRGINFIQVPTTLLSQVDSSVGGKTGVNHPLGKNMIGAFYQPQAVIIDTDVLKTLPPREVAAGMAEVIKYGLIADLPFYEWLETNIADLMALDSKLIGEAIARSCQCKADVVGQDETEKGIRAILNLGHTFGHAIETALGYGQWLHGEAVAAGMVAALDLSARLGCIEAKETDRLCKLLAAAKLPTRLPDSMTADDFLENMMRDKKVLNGELRLILLESVGKASIVDKVSSEHIRATIDACT